LDVGNAGYQFDYVFDWTILKYPQISGSSSRGRVSAFISCLFGVYFLVEVTNYICSNNSMTVARRLWMQGHLYRDQKSCQVYSGFWPN